MIGAKIVRMPNPIDSSRLDNTRKFFMSAPTNQMNDVLHLLAPGVTYTVQGRSPLSGVFHGPEEVAQHLAALLALSKGSFDLIKWIDWMVGETHIAALQYAQLQRKSMIYRGHHLYVVEHDHNDALSDIKVFFEDEDLFTRFISS
jgi:hypothetical protein